MLNFFKYIHIFVLTAIFVIVGCGKHSSSTSNTEEQDFNFGKTVNNSVKSYMAESENAPQKLSAYSGHEAKVIDSVNHIIENTMKKEKTRGSEVALNKYTSVGRVLQEFYKLVENNTIPQMTDALARLLREASKDEEGLKALCNFLNTRTGADFQNIIELAYRCLNYEKNKELWNTFANMVENNPELIKSSCGVFHDLVNKIPEDDASVAMIGKLLAILTTTFNQKNDTKYGYPVWLARLDKNDNPKVLKDENDTLIEPFVDGDGDGVCDCKSETDQRPIDKNGKILNIPAFGKQEYKNKDGKVLIKRDQYFRAITPDGKFVFNYYNAKNTILSLALLSFANSAKGNKTGYEIPNFSHLRTHPLKSSLIKLFLQALNLARIKETKELMTGFKVMIATKEPAQVKQAFLGLGNMLWQELRDNKNINSVEAVEHWFEQFGNNPPQQFFPMLQLMSQTQVPGSQYPNMVMLFFSFVSQNKHELSEFVWSTIQILRYLHQKYPGLTEQFYNSSCQALFGSLELFKHQEVKELLKGFIVILNKFDPKQVREAFLGLGDMVARELRDNPNIDSKEKIDAWFGQFGNNPPQQFFPMLQLMSQTQIPGSQYPNMVMLFFTVVSKHHSLLSDILWPSVVMMRTVNKFTPGTMDKVYKAIINFTIRKEFLEFIKRFEAFSKTKDYQVIKEALIYFATPQVDHNKDVFSELVKVMIGTLEYRNDTLIKIRLIKMLNKLFDPRNPVVMHFLKSTAGIIRIDQEFIFLNVMKGSCKKCKQHEKAPLIIYSLANIDVMRAANSHTFKREIVVNDMKNMFHALAECFTHPDSLVQRLYVIIRNNRDKK